jgi:hypothetical protein
MISICLRHEIKIARIGEVREYAQRSTGLF